MKDYFDYWEKYTTDSRELLLKAFEYRNASRWRSYAKASDAVFPLEVFIPAEALLKKAESAAASGKDKDAAARVNFLRKGFEHAKLCVKAGAALAGKASQTDIKKALDELVAFRRKTEDDFISDFASIAWSEKAGWRLPQGYK